MPHSPQSTLQSRSRACILQSAAEQTLRTVIFFTTSRSAADLSRWHCFIGFYRLLSSCVDFIEAVWTDSLLLWRSHLVSLDLLLFSEASNTYSFTVKKMITSDTVLFMCPMIGVLTLEFSKIHLNWFNCLNVMMSIRFLFGKDLYFYSPNADFQVK